MHVKAHVNNKLQHEGQEKWMRWDGSRLVSAPWSATGFSLYQHDPHAHFTPGSWLNSLHRDLNPNRYYCAIRAIVQADGNRGWGEETGCLELVQSVCASCQAKVNAAMLRRSEVSQLLGFCHWICPLMCFPNMAVPQELKTMHAVKFSILSIFLSIFTRGVKEKMNQSEVTMLILPHNIFKLW